MSASDVRQFQSVSKELKKNGFFIDTCENEFVVGEKKYKENWGSLLGKLEEKAPVMLVDTLDEARIFALAFTLALKKDWKY